MPSYLLDERHVFLVSGIGTVFVLHLNCNNRAAPGVLHINKPTDRQRTTEVLRHCSWFKTQQRRWIWNENSLMAHRASQPTLSENQMFVTDSGYHDFIPSNHDATLHLCLLVWLLACSHTMFPHWLSSVGVALHQAPAGPQTGLEGQQKFLCHMENSLQKHTIIFSPKEMCL